MKKYLFLFLLIPKIFIAQEKLTLESCIDRAIQKSISISINQYNMEIAGYQLLIAYSNFIPQVVATASGGYNIGSNLQQVTTASQILYLPLYTEGVSASGKISATLTLFDGVNNIASVLAAARNKESAELTLDRAKEVIRQDVTQKYFQIFLDRELLIINQKNVDKLSETLRLTEAQFKAGLRQESDYLQQNADKINAEINVLDIQNKLGQDKLILLQSTRYDIAKEYDFLPPVIDSSRIDAMYENVPFATRYAIENRKDLLSSQKDIENKSWNEVVAQSVLYPRISAYANIGTNVSYTNRAELNGISQSGISSQQSIWDQLPNKISYSAGLTFSWSLDNIYSGIFQANIAAMQTTITKANKDKLQQDIEYQVISAIMDYQLTRKKLVATEKSFDAASLSFRIIEEKYKKGISTIIEFQNASASVLNAQAQLTQGLFNLALKKKNLFYIIGYISKK